MNRVKRGTAWTLIVCQLVSAALFKLSACVVAAKISLQVAHGYTCCSSGTCSRWSASLTQYALNIAESVPHNRLQTVLEINVNAWLKTTKHQADCVPVIIKFGCKSYVLLQNLLQSAPVQQQPAALYTYIA